jgi:hypothetical protein
VAAAVSVHEEPVGATEGVWRSGGVLRDIARGGFAGLIVGILVGGIGGRLAMRLAAIAVPESTGAFTENGNRIGTITLGGSVGLIVFAGLAVGLVGAVLWVTVQPWIPGRTAVRALLAMPVAVALGSFGLIQGENVDFEVLDRQPVIIGILVGLVMLAGAALVLVDAWLDRHLPQADAPTLFPAGVYAVVTLIGMVLGALVIVGYLSSENRAAGIALLVVGVATLATWGLRLRGRDDVPTVVAVLGYGGLAVAVALGLATAWSEVAFALRI